MIRGGSVGGEWKRSGRCVVGGDLEGFFLLFFIVYGFSISIFFYFYFKKFVFWRFVI